MKTFAAQRLMAALEEDAAFDGDKDHELETLAKQMQRAGYPFRKTDSHLVLHLQDSQVQEDAERIATELNKLGWKLRIKQGVYSNPTFALKGKDGIVLQKINKMLRIFFTK